MTLATVSDKIFLHRPFFRYLSLNNVLLYVNFLLCQLEFISNVFTEFLLCAKHCLRFLRELVWRFYQGSAGTPISLTEDWSSPLGGSLSSLTEHTASGWTHVDW